MTAAVRPKVWTTDAGVIAEDRRYEAATVLTRNMRPAICETRHGKPDDLAFVVDCWVKKLGREDSMSRSVATRHARRLLGVADKALFELPAVLPRLLIAHVPGEPDAILGWAAYETGALVYWPDGTPNICDRNHVRSHPCIHYVYVRSAARRQGIARCLVGGVAHVEYSHAAPKGFVVPKDWILNTARAQT